ncbi:MAG: flavodoxin family protein [Actinobacteria bacterium]|jgi:multimeric flavodoxin WrbA|nr:flavodoxin family protein [Actinomycetota bacterium]
MVMRLLGLSFSPRKNSNSSALLRTSFDRLLATYPGEVECETIDVRELHVEPCDDCDVCGKSKGDGRHIPCIRAEDDDVQGVLDKMVAAHGFIVATPVYFGLPSDLFSKFIMRTRVLRHQDFRLANRVAGVMAIAARRSGGAETTILSTWLPLIRNGCLVVGNGDQTCQYGAMGWASARNHILTDEWGLEQGFQVAQRVFTVAKLVQTGIQTLHFHSPMTFDYTSGTRP